MTPVDRSSPVPLWLQVLDDLRRRLASGDFAGQLPGEAALKDVYGVSRQTMREALRRLADEGHIDRGRGRGTFVRTRPVVQRLGPLYSLYALAEEQGFAQKSVVRHLELRRNRRAAARLRCEPGEPLVYLERLRLIDGQPVVLDGSWLPGSLTSALLEADFCHTALYRELALRCGIHPDAGWERVAPVVPDELQRDLLGLEPGAPAFRIERLARAGEQPVEWRQSVVRSDLFELVARWEPGLLKASFEAPDDDSAPPFAEASEDGA